MPLFKSTRNIDDDDFRPTVPADTVPEGGMTVVSIDRKRVILTRVAGEIYAIDHACPHAAADLTKGWLRRGGICCSEHDYCFDIKSGRITWPEDEFYRLRRYPVIVEAGVVKVSVSSAL